MDKRKGGILLLCPYCKEKLPEEGTNCPHCGAPIDRSLLEEAPPAPEPAKEVKKPKKRVNVWRRLRTMAATALFLFGMLIYTAIENWSVEDTMDAVTQMAEKTAQFAYDKAYEKTVSSLPFTYEPQPLGTYDTDMLVRKNADDSVNFLELAHENLGVYAFRETIYRPEGDQPEQVLKEAEAENDRWSALSFAECEISREDGYIKTVRTLYRLELSDHYWEAEDLGLLPFFAEDGENLQISEVLTQLKLQGYFVK